MPESLSSSEAQSLLDKCGPNFSVQLKAVLKKLLVTDKDVAYRAFEHIARECKSGGAAETPEALLFDATLKEEQIAAKAEYAKQYAKTSADPEDDGALRPMCAIPNFLEEAEMFQWAGVGSFSEAENLLVMKALMHFPQTDNGLKKIRLWGKILGTENDYWIAEGKTDQGGEEHDPETNPLFEPLGTGANAHAYWVCTDLAGGEWTRLPDAQAKYIGSSAGVRKLFTGNLDADVIAEPKVSGEDSFTGKKNVVFAERDYLRAVIARITSETVLTVKNYMLKDEDSGEITENEEFVFPSAAGGDFASLGTSAGWCHFVEGLLKIGRCSYLEIDGENEETAEEFERQELRKAADPEQGVLRELNPADWSFKVAHGCSPSEPTAYGASVKWPGAVVVCGKGQFSNIYCGYGVAREAVAGADENASDFVTPVVQSEPEMAAECPEPTPEGGPPAPEAQEEEQGE